MAFGAAFSFFTFASAQLYARRHAEKHRFNSTTCSLVGNIRILKVRRLPVSSVCRLNGGGFLRFSASSGGSAVGGGALSFVFALLFATGAATFSVQASAENGDDRHDVVRKIFFGGV